MELFPVLSINSNGLCDPKKFIKDKPLSGGLKRDSPTRTGIAALLVKCLVNCWTHIKVDTTHVA